MRGLADIVSKGLSVVFYPLFIPTYGMILFCTGISVRAQMLPAIYWVVAIGATFFFTCFIPLSIIAYMLRKRQIQSLDMSDPKERHMPYLYTLGGYAFWAYFVYAVLKGPVWMVVTAIGATVVLGLVAYINQRWKISAHSAGIGGLTGGMASFCLFYGVEAIWPLLTMFGVSLIVMCSRLYANAHTDHQVVAGYLLGIIGTFIPTLITIVHA